MNAKSYHKQALLIDERCIFEKHYKDKIPLPYIDDKGREGESCLIACAIFHSQNFYFLSPFKIRQYDIAVRSDLWCLQMVSFFSCGLIEICSLFFFFFLGGKLYFFPVISIPPFIYKIE